MQGIAVIFFSATALVLVWLIADAIRTGSIWVRGARHGWISFSTWAHKRERESEPGSFWGFFIFYVCALCFMLWALLFELT
ncbi:MAG: hypothetical protein AAF290_10485 [Pseudomonadota bacterium]